MQEMEGCDTGQDSVNGLPIDSVVAVETPVNNSSKGEENSCYCACIHEC